MNYRQARKLWVKALRSGEYTQGSKFMRCGDRHCCLGVAQEVAIKCGVKFIPDWSGTPYLPSEVGQWLKLGHEDQINLAEANDGELAADNGKLYGRFTFDDIALLIEHLP